MARPAPGAIAPTHDLALYAERLRPLVDEALQVRAGWLVFLDELDRRRDFEAAADEALAAAAALAQLRAALRAIEPPPACRRAHAALGDWLEALRASCAPLADAERPGRAEVAVARERLRAVAAAAEKFNRESRRVPAILRAVPLLQRRAPIRPITIVAIVRRMYSESWLLGTLRFASLAQSTISDIDLKLEEPDHAVVIGTVDQPGGPVRVRVTFQIGLTPEGKIHLAPAGIEGVGGARVPPGLAAALPKHMEQLNAQVASRLPGKPIRNVYVQGGRVVFVVEEA